MALTAAPHRYAAPTVNLSLIKKFAEASHCKGDPLTTFTKVAGLNFKLSLISKTYPAIKK